MGVLFARRLRSHELPPRTPTNEDRIRAYRALAPVTLANERQWKWHARQYAQEAVPGPEYDNDLREGFALKYGEKA